MRLGSVAQDRPAEGGPRGRGTPRKGTPRKGTPRKGTPRKGTPRKGTPRKGVGLQPEEGPGPEICYAVGAFLFYPSRRYGVEFFDVFARWGRPAAVRASRAIQVAF